MGGQSFDPRQVARDIGLTNDAFVNGMLATEVYVGPAKTTGELLSKFPDVKRTALLDQYAHSNTIQAYMFANWKLWVKEQLFGTFPKAVSSDPNLVSDPDLSYTLRLDHAEESLKAGDLAQTVRLLTGCEDGSTALGSWLNQAKQRLSKEENVKVLQVYTDKLVELNRKHRRTDKV